MSEHITKSHNKTLLLYHFVFPTKYRRKVFDDKLTKVLKETCLQKVCISLEVHFVEIWADEDHVHFLVQSVPTLSVTQIITGIKSITARQIFHDCPEVKKILYWWNFWTSWYYANTVWQFANEQTIKKYVQNQWKEYYQMHRDQLTLFEGLV